MHQITECHFVVINVYQLHVYWKLKQIIMDRNLCLPYKKARETENTGYTFSPSLKSKCAI